MLFGCKGAGYLSTTGTLVVAAFHVLSMGGGVAYGIVVPIAVKPTASAAISSRDKLSGSALSFAVTKIQNFLNFCTVNLIAALCLRVNLDCIYTPSLDHVPDCPLGAS